MSSADFPDRYSRSSQTEEGMFPEMKGHWSLSPEDRGSENGKNAEFDPVIGNSSLSTKSVSLLAIHKFEHDTRIYMVLVAEVRPTRARLEVASGLDVGASEMRLVSSSSSSSSVEGGVSGRASEWDLCEM